MICLYHDDLDGRTAAAIVKHYDSSARCFQADHYKPLPIHEIKTNESVVIVDFTPVCQADWDKIFAKTAFVTWIDHHQKNIIKYPQYANLDGLRADTYPSGALLTWNYFYGPKGMEAPEFVKLVSDYDTWSFKCDLSKPFEAGMSALEQSPDAPIWENLFRDCQYVDEVVRNGNIVLEYRSRINRHKLEAYAFEVEFEGHKCIACDAGQVNMNFFESVFGKYDIYIPFYFDGSTFRFTLYTQRDDLSVADIAIKHGGGGHPKAAGFESKTLPFEKKAV